MVMETKQIYPLAVPKGKIHKCIVCNRLAWIRCQTCRTVAYCNKEHQELDQRGIHQLICTTLRELYAEPKRVIRKSEKERFLKKLLDAKLRIINVCLLRAQKNLFEGNYQLVKPAAFQSMRLYKEIYKTQSAHAIPAFLLLAEALFGLDRLPEACNYLSFAIECRVKSLYDWKSPNSYKVYRTLAKMYLVKEEYELSIENLAEDIYFASELYGTQAIQTSGGYYNMANVYFYLGNSTLTNSLYKKVVDIWYKFLKDVADKKLSEDAEEDQLPSRTVPFHGIDEAQSAEAKLYLKSIYEWWQASKSNHTMHFAKLCLGMSFLSFVILETIEARRYVMEAKEILQNIKGDQEMLKEMLKEVEVFLTAVMPRGRFTPNI